MKVGIACVSALALALFAGAAQAQSPEVSFNIGATTDYVFRGVSQTDGEAALQGGVDVSFGSFYVGAWASIVDFGDDTDAELDVYGGYLFDAGGFDFDVGVISYTYLNAPDGADYDLVEFKAAVSRSIDRWSVGAAAYYSPDFFGVDEEATYIEANAGYEASDVLSLSGAVGKQFLDVGADYTTWNFGGELAIAEFATLDLRYHDSHVDGPLGEQRFTATLGFAF